MTVAMQYASAYASANIAMHSLVRFIDVHLAKHCMNHCEITISYHKLFDIPYFILYNLLIGFIMISDETFPWLVQHSIITKNIS